ncbi:MAG: hypothetical protein ABI697_10295 [Devosia sp.]
MKMGTASTITAGLLAIGVIGFAAAASGQDLSGLANAKNVMPQGYVFQMGFLKCCGVIYDAANEADFPAYGVYRGKVVYVEFTFHQGDLSAAKQWDALPGLQGLSKVDHASFLFEPTGHGPTNAPQYVLRLWFASAAQLAAMRQEDATEGNP